MLQIKLQKIVGNLLVELRKLYMSGACSRLEIFSRPQVAQVIDNSRQYLLLRLRYFIFQKTVVGCP